MKIMKSWNWSNHLKIQKISFSGSCYRKFWLCRKPSYTSFDSQKSVFQLFDKSQFFFDRTANFSACDKAKIAHESSLKSSVFEVKDSFTSFQDFMISMPVEVQSSPCPLSNSFSRIYQHLISACASSGKNSSHNPNMISMKSALCW